MCEPCSDVCVNDSKKLWKNGIIPYEFDYKVSEDLIRYVKSAMKEIAKIGSIKFVKRTNQLDYIKIVNGGAYWSYVGKQGGEQELSVTEGWPHPIGSSIHELLHACGMYHEHSRPDRDKYLIVQNGNDNYKKHNSSNVTCFGNYDFESIMHYPLHSRMNLKPGIKKKFEIGQRVKLSKGDIKAINMLYPCLSTESEDNCFKRENRRQRVIIYIPISEREGYGYCIIVFTKCRHSN
ncbi:peptidase family M12A-domain-containing protein [Rhizophagus clarus]|uniref:Metalloendopeptidase n=1 Tax=Rhizophagus clarus TaxID=94130 RepID=A0A8H3L957_9GLOM|nr:peptidase family M12A-domain-containing protein [Rhizophagus clarus]